MKKLLFILSFIFLICACTKTQPESKQKPSQKSMQGNLQDYSQEISAIKKAQMKSIQETSQDFSSTSLPISITESSCKIGEYDCWDIIKDIKNETQPYPSRETASNPALEKKKLPIVEYYKSYAGNSQHYKLSNQANISIYHNESDEKKGVQGYITVTDPITKKTIIYDTKGNITSTKHVLTESLCKIDGEYDCWDVIQDIKSNSKRHGVLEPEAYSALEKKGISIAIENMFDDGGSLGYILSNNIDIFIHYEMFCNRNKTCGYTTITDFISKKKITYDTKGNIVNSDIIK